jgi:hypothetical protein
MNVPSEKKVLKPCYKCHCNKNFFGIELFIRSFLNLMAFYVFSILTLDYLTFHMNVPQEKSFEILTPRANVVKMSQ